MTWHALSDHAIAQLAQFRMYDEIPAGDLVSKAGRDELMTHGYVAGGRGVFWLTQSGLSMAARMADGDWFNEHRSVN